MITHSAFFSSQLGATAPFSWTARTSSFSGTDIFWVDSDDSGNWVAVGAGGKIADSTNGTSWTQRTSNFAGENVASCVYDPGNSLWIASGNAGKLSTSPDRTTWTARTSAFGSDWIGGLGTDGSGNSVIVGNNSKTADSTNGTSWTLRTDTFTTFGSDANYGNSIWVAVGADNEISTSTNRTSWTDRANPITSTYIRSVVYSATEGLWVAVAYNGQICSAPDPTSTWTARTSGLGATENIHSVDYGNGYFVAAADDGEYTYSTDGINWTASTIPAFVTGPDIIRSISYDTTDDLWVAVGLSGILATSPGS